MRRTELEDSWPGPGQHQNSINIRVREKPVSLSSPSHLQAGSCLGGLAEGDDDDGGEDEEPDHVGDGEDEGRNDAI